MPTTPHVTIEEELQNAAPSKLSLRGVHKRFEGRSGATLALEDFSLEVGEGEFVCLVGPSGCGKSTILNLIAGLEVQTAGEVLLDGTAITGPGRDRMVMFQEPALFPWLDVLGNVLFGLKLKPNLTKSEREQVALFYLTLVGLEKSVHANIHELSGGMRQRVALARCLAPNPRILLMDEPFSALDALTRETLYGDLQRIFTQRRKTIVLVTHNIREAVCMGDRVVLLSPHPGRIREVFDVKIRRPRDMNSPQVAELSKRITTALKQYLKTEDMQ
ncbi:MAG: ABC transporter ATP-binding protein [Puniceicoccales bacterium]|jgi:NitT/TauT family transport system ATP-binding protein|nr:ABC transporter ATP-binding protein [Puniceicoccales bacterium]